MIGKGKHSTRQANLHRGLNKLTERLMEQLPNTPGGGLPPEIQRDRDVERLAKKAKLPPYMWDTLEGLAALGRFMDAARATVVRSETAARNPHSIDGEQDTKLLAASTPAKTMAPGYHIEYWNLTMVRIKGDVVLSVRLPSLFSHYVEINGEQMAAWHPGAVSSVRFTRELWKTFVEQVAEADKIRRAADELDAI